MRKFIVFLIRRKLGLKNCEKFRFTGQKDKLSYYYFDGCVLMKNCEYKDYKSTVSFNWILDDDCEVEKV